MQRFGYRRRRSRTIQPIRQITVLGENRPGSSNDSEDFMLFQGKTVPVQVVVHKILVCLLVLVNRFVHIIFRSTSRDVRVRVSVCLFDVPFSRGIF